MIEVRDLLAKDEILEQCRSAKARAQRMLIVGDRHALVRRERSSTGIDENTPQRTVHRRRPNGSGRGCLGRRVLLGDCTRRCRCVGGLDCLTFSRGKSLGMPGLVLRIAIEGTRSGERIHGARVFRLRIVRDGWRTLRRRVRLRRGLRRRLRGRCGLSRGLRHTNIHRRREWRQRKPVVRCA